MEASAEALAILSDDVRGLWCPQSIPMLNEPPSSLEFFRNFVAKSMPCIIRNAIRSEDGSTPLLLSLDDLVNICTNSSDNRNHSESKDMLLTVDVTPDGNGDCIRTVRERGKQGTRTRMFVKPEERQMTMTQFREELRRGHGEWTQEGQKPDNHGESLQDEDGLEIHDLYIDDDNDAQSNSSPSDDAVPTDPTKKMASVLYYSRQNDCLRTELQPLFDEGIFPQSIAFAQEAFDTGPPDAINLWIGDERSVSSMHKDHYENLFHVLHGEKLFTLCPPADIPFLHEGDFESGTFSSKSHNNNDSHEPQPCEWSVVSDHDNNASNQSNNDETTVKWIEPDIDKFIADSSHNNGNGGYGKRFPLMHHAHPIQVRVKAGEMLYLPALWFHRVTQTCETVGINYWYDMKFDSSNWCYFNFLQQLKAKEGTPINNNK